MQDFHFSQRSMRSFEGVDPRLFTLAKRALFLSPVDFVVTDGKRTLEVQKQLLAAHRTQTLHSFHIDGDGDGDGDAIDVMPFVNGRGTYNGVFYPPIADAFKTAAKELGLQVRWGAAWNVYDIANYPGAMAEATKAYVAGKVARGETPFLDYPHFELRN